MPRSNKTIALVVATLAAALGGCSEYLSNTSKIGVTAGDAIAINRATMMVDPWPVAAGQRNIAFNGQKMQSAVERYRNNRAYAPRGMSTSGNYQPTADSSGDAQNTTPVGQPVAAPPTK